MSKLPEGWELVKLSDLLKLKGGNAFKSNDFSDFGIPILKISNINKNGQIDLKDYVCVEELEEYRDYLLSENDIVVAMSGATTGKMGKVKSKDLPLYLNQRVGKFEIKAKKKLDNDFLYFNVTNPKFIEKLLVNAIGGAQPNISSKQIEELKISLPPLEEQKKIADILSTVDQKIAFVEKNISQTQELKKGLMQKLLTQGLGHTEFKDSEIGKIPKSWEIKSIEDIAEVKGGKRLPKGYELSEKPTPYPYIRVTNMSMGKLNDKQMLYVPIEIQPKIKNYTISKNDLYIAVAGNTLGMVGWIPEELDNANLTENADKICNIRINKTFLLFVLMSNLIQNEIQNQVTSNAQPKLALTRIKTFLIPMPPLEEQKQIAEILSTVDKKIENLKEKKQSFEELKKGLMQKLLTGEVRV